MYQQFKSNRATISWVSHHGDKPLGQCAAKCETWTATPVSRSLSDKPSTLLGPKRKCRTTPTRRSTLCDVAFVLMQVNTRRVYVRSRTVDPSQFPRGIMVWEGRQHGQCQQWSVENGSFGAGCTPRVVGRPSKSLCAYWTWRMGLRFIKDAAACSTALSTASAL